MDLRQTELYHDLMTDARDPLYRAFSYLQRRGGPPIEGLSDRLALLQANRSKMLAWLEAQKERERIAAEYIEFKRNWSPIFPE
ncbi:MAG: hypothetical protein MPW16_06335 [Candidatus Manganitrophus sp.]|nr:MAG: hypothetical protein MPW16_06335 [Candidatus Manganitrophus sp.]